MLVKHFGKWKTEKIELSSTKGHTKSMEKVMNNQICWVAHPCNCHLIEHVYHAIRIYISRKTKCHSAIGGVFFLDPSIGTGSQQWQIAWRKGSVSVWSTQLFQATACVLGMAQGYVGLEVDLFEWGAPLWRLVDICWNGEFKWWSNADSNCAVTERKSMQNKKSLLSFMDFQINAKSFLCLLTPWK